MYGYNSFYFHFLIIYLIYGCFVISINRSKRIIDFSKSGNGVVNRPWEFCNLTRSRKRMIFLLSFPLFLLGILRGDTVGGDLEYYIAYFDEFCKLNSFWNVSDVSSQEPGYQLYTYLISRLSSSHLAFFFFTFVLSLIGPVYMIAKYSTMPLYSFFLYFSLGFYTNTFNNVRQSIAISICFLAFRFLFKSDFFKYLGMVLLATTFHYSAIITLLMYPLVGNTVTIKKIIIYLSAGVGLYIFASVSILSFFINLLAFKYGDMDLAITSESRGYGMMALYALILLGELFLYRRSKMIILERSEINIKHNMERMSFFIQLQLLALLCQMFAPLFASMLRMTFYFFIPIVVVIPYLASTYKPYKKTILTISTIGALLYVSMVFGLNKELNSNSQGVIPYVLINTVIY